MNDDLCDGKHPGKAFVPATTRSIWNNELQVDFKSWASQLKLKNKSSKNKKKDVPKAGGFASALSIRDSENMSLQSSRNRLPKLPKNSRYSSYDPKLGSNRKIHRQSTRVDSNRSDNSSGF